MRKILFLFLLISSLNSFADDMTRLGFKGQLNKSSISGSYSGTESYTFDDFGNISKFYTDRYGASITTTSLNSTSTGFSGTCETEGIDGKVTITIGKNGITKIYVKYDTGSLTVNNSYDSNGRLIKKTYNETWYTEEELTFETNIEEEAEKLFQRQQTAVEDLYNPRNILNPERAAQKYIDATERNANAYVSNARAGFRKKKVKHTKNETYIFSNYVDDEFGNWTERTVKKQGDNASNKELNTIQYTNEFLSEYYWNKLKDSGDLRAIERFALLPTTTSKYKTLAVDFWNSKILDEIETVYHNNCDSLCKVAFGPITNKDISNKALDIARKDIFDNQVMLERDYTKVPLFKGRKMSGHDIFDDAYKAKIDERSLQLRNDSIAFLIKKAESEIANNNNLEASKTSRIILRIDNQNTHAKELAATSEFNLLVEKENSGSTTDKDYEYYRKANIGSQYDAAVADKHIMYAMSRKKEFKDSKRMCEYSDYLDNLSNLPMTEDVLSKYKKSQKRAYFSCMHGSFVNVGFGAFAGYSLGNEIHYGGEVGARFGYLCNILNVYIGAKYSYSAGFNSMDSKNKHNDDYTKDGYLSAHRITIPAILRINVKPNYFSAIYLGIGAEYSIPLNSKYTYYNVSQNSNWLTIAEDVSFSKTNSDSDKNMLRKSYIAPRFGIGITAQYLELELYGIYDKKGTLYDKEYLDKLGVETLIHSKQYEKQTEKAKLRFGLAARIMF